MNPKDVLIIVDVDDNLADLDEEYAAVLDDHD